VIGGSEEEREAPMLYCTRQWRSGWLWVLAFVATTTATNAAFTSLANDNLMEDSPLSTLTLLPAADSALALTPFPQVAGPSFATVAAAATSPVTAEGIVAGSAGQAWLAPVSSDFGLHYRSSATPTPPAVDARRTAVSVPLPALGIAQLILFAGTAALFGKRISGLRR